MMHLREWTASFTLRLEELKRSEDGQGLVEYSLILLLVSIVSIVILTTLGTSISEVFQSVVNAL
jgi:pilus assembly protein Flp/PilA